MPVLRYQSQISCSLDPFSWVGGGEWGLGCTDSIWTKYPDSGNQDQGRGGPLHLWENKQGKPRESETGCKYFWTSLKWGLLGGRDLA